MIKLFQGDCRDVLKAIPDKSVDLVIMDPPYEMGTSGGGMYRGHKKAYIDELNSMKDGFDLVILDELCRVMKHVNLYVFCTLKQFPMLIDYFVKEKKCYWSLLTWHKTNPVPACNNKYLSDTEYILFFREPGVHIWGSYATKKTYYVTPLNVKDKKLYNHPTVKPDSIIRALVANSSQPGEVVLDPFMGSGTTGAVCASEGRLFLGIEKDEVHFCTAEKRINEAINLQTENAT